MVGAPVDNNGMKKESLKNQFLNFSGFPPPSAEWVLSVLLSPKPLL